jgi:hypothetical protein
LPAFVLLGLAFDAVEQDAVVVGVGNPKPVTVDLDPFRPVEFVRAGALLSGADGADEPVSLIQPFTCELYSSAMYSQPRSSTVTYFGSLKL